MFCGLEKERTRFRKEKKKRKEKKGKKRKNKEKKWIGWDERVSKDLQPCEIFFAVLNPVLNETAFYVKLAGRFLGSKTKVT